MGGSEAFVPLSLFRNYSCTLDYGQGTFTLNPSVKPGVRVPVSIFPSSGFMRIEAIIDGVSMGFLLDTGAACTMLSRAVLDPLVTKHPDWAFVNGAYGPANMVGGAFDGSNVMLKVPQVAIGSIDISDEVVVSRRTGIFEKSMTRLMDSLIVGAIAGDILSQYILTIDYPSSVVFLDPHARSISYEYSMVPISMTASDDYPTIDRVADGADSSLRRALSSGDRLIAVDGRAASGIPLQNVFEMLLGSPGTTRQLTVKRGTTVFAVSARVVQII